MHHPCHGCFEALHTLAHTSLLRGSPDDQNARMLHMEAAAPVSGRGRQRNGEAQAKRPGAPCCLEANVGIAGPPTRVVPAKAGTHNHGLWLWVPALRPLRGRRPGRRSLGAVVAARPPLEFISLLLIEDNVQ